LGELAGDGEAHHAAADDRAVELLCHADPGYRACRPIAR
jgi:hypothetical protein